MNTRIPCTILLVLLLPVTPALAQSFYQPEPVDMAGFGQSVGLGADLILTGEPGGFKHPGTVHIYARNAEGGWNSSGMLQAPDANVDDGFGYAVTFEGSMLAIGSGSEVITYERVSDSDTFVMTGHLQHTATALALSGDRLAVGSGLEEGNSGVVRVYKQDEGWQLEAVLEAPRSREAFGMSLALDGDQLAVGTARGNGVSTYRYADGAWASDAELTGADYGVQSGFGSAVDVRGSRLLIGAPAAGMAVLLEADAGQGWTVSATMSRPAGQQSERFGAAVQLTDDAAWIGAPGADQGRGRIYQHAYGELASVLPEGLPGAGIGGSFVTDGRIAAVGMPRKAYGEGSVLVLENRDGWRLEAELFNAAEPMAAIADASEVCAQGRALDYDCAGVDLLSFLPLADMEAARGVRLNDVWGWTDPETGAEYALVGHLEGAAFINVSDPMNPVYLGTLPRTDGSPGSTWRDIKVYRNHAYIVADGADAHGMQVFDLTQLRDLEVIPTNFAATAHYDQIHSAHNIVINEATGFAYAVGASGGGETCGGGLHMIDLREPRQPAFAGCFADVTTGRRNTGYSHDAQCVIYHGPDAEYQGREICIGANETAISISDVTDKANPVAVGTGTYPDAAYVHQGWLSEDHGWYFQNDELDEISGRAERTRTLVWDVRDLADPQMVREFFGPTSATDHNLYVHGDLMYQTNNASGLRVIDISTPDNPVEVGFFDTTPYGTDESGFNGTWSSYPYFKSGIIVVTSRREGLFILRNQSVDT
ncbi:MAG: choice-of-anchor B family protein [Bacteroidota bacterium]|nr:choice-of-anchor B family protein [Bacteroidota bacterium]